MSSLSPPAVLSSLDDSLALPFATLEVLKAVRSIDVEGVIKRLSVAAESNRNLRSLVASVLPEASWQTREELDALLADVSRISETRSRFLALVIELESGSIVHRRALRVAEVNQLREQAIIELRSHAESGKLPPILPGPEAGPWIEWACGLKEPEDAASLQTLRNGFASLDDFVAHLEPEMWVAKNETRVTLSNGADVANPVQEVQEQTRFRLLALATELTHGSIQHHRTIRVSQLNRLRQEAINELRSRAESEAVPSTLPGPEAHNWIEWACGLREPEDTKALESLRFGFPYLDDFVANLDLDVWSTGRSLPEEVQVENEDAVDKVPQEPCRVEAAKVDDSPVSSRSTPIALKAAKPSEEFEESQVPDTLDKPSQPVPELNELIPTQVTASPIEEEAQPSAHLETSAMPEISFRLTTGVGEARTKKLWMPIAIAAFVVLGAYGAIELRWHRNPTVPAKASEGETSALTHRQSNQGSDPSEVLTDFGTNAYTQTQAGREAALQNRGVGLRTIPTAASATQATIQDDGRLSRSATMASNVASLTKETAFPKSATQPQNAVPTGVQSPSPDNTPSVAKDNPTGQSMLAAQKLRIAPGGVRGLVIRRVAPLYPASARQAHIEGIVVLQALIGKDGTVLNVRVLSGHPMLIQAAVEAAKQWHFDPYYLDGAPVEADTQINVNFTLQGD